MESFLITEKYVPKDQLILIAKGILKSQSIKEDSFYTDNNNFPKYKKSNSVAAEEAIENSIKNRSFWVQIISCWNTFRWSEVQEWAKGILNDK
jgi:hypothetical protein